ncbi:MAG: ABC transporter ATP-binding protein, partial [Gammaproteobacteria bacterium]|nr:ABC transporter ATP-binding protein [Gammaproteobacteria bacterium]
MNPLAENNPLLANDIALRVEDLSAGYGLVPVLDKISLQIPKSHILGVLGHNGMGKSTLLKCLVGLIPIQSGSIWFDGEPFQDFPPYHRAQTGIAFVPQGRGIIAGISTEENLLLAWHASSGWTPTQALEFSLSLFPRLKRLLSRLGGRLSGGEQQLLALARCMMINPWFLLLDEPTEGIQPNIIQEISATLLQLQKNQKISILLVEQNLDFISSCANRVAILEKGRFIANLSPEEMLQQAESLLGLGGRLGTSEFSQVSPPNPSTQRLSAGHPQSPHPAQIPSSHLPPLSPNTQPHPPNNRKEE